MILLIVLLVNFTSVQNYIVGQATKFLSKKLDTEVSIQHIRIDPLNKLLVQGVFVKDKQNDTLLYAGELQFRITDWFIFRDGVPVIEYVGLKDAYANLYRTSKSDEWNYQFIADAFASDSPKPKKNSQGSFNIDLRTVDLANVRFNMNDAWVGSDMNFAVGSFSIDADKIDLEKKIIDIDDIEAVSTKVILRDYDGGRPPKPRDTTTKAIDTTAFNPGMWLVKASDINLKDCYFSLDVGSGDGLPNEFDPAHIRVRDIQLDVENIQILGDTLTAELNNLSAKERCGLIVKKMQSDVRVSPTESICKDLTLQTNNSNIREYYAMHYERFPDFLDYINKVRMDARLQKTQLDSRDIAYFATVLREYPTILNISGSIVGTVTNIKARELFLTDGQSIVKGNLDMEGLPDIESTYINFSNGQLMTSGAGIFKYAPELKDNEAVDLSSITRAYFEGDFKGYINDFVINGSIATNLGNIIADVKMEVPKDNAGNTVYQGKVNVDNVNLGVLLRQPDLGSVTLRGDVNGVQSKTEETAITFKTVIDFIEYKQYKYQNINVDGKVEKDKFTGDLLISDPNVALGFYGELDYSKDKLKINAKANLLQSNLTALNLIQDDSVTLTADFDMDWEGVDVDDFIGYAKLYNIDLNRNGHQLDLDSVYVNATEAENGRKISVKSNALAATLQGQYKLTSLPSSFQYYVSGYLPNYIAAPDTVVPDQDIRFSITTNDLDSLFGIFAPSISGFNNAVIKGYLNTYQQKLQLDADIPYGKVNDYVLKNTVIQSTGDFKQLNLNAGIGTIVFADTSKKGTLKLNTTLGNDKLNFKLTTASPYTVGDAVLSGEAIAHGDTLTASIYPSEFYLNKNLWRITGGNKIIYTDGYLSISDFFLKSEAQTVAIQSSNTGLNQSIKATISNLHASEIGAVAGSNLDITGNINGYIQVNNLFTDMLITSNIKADHVAFGNDTLGNVSIGGSYDSKKHLVNLDPETGIYNGSQSITANGKISFDDKYTEQIDGLISLNQAQLPWLAPLLEGFVSDIHGSLDGKIKISGSSSAPDIDGAIRLNDIAMHIDFLGTKYSIPDGQIDINNKEIDLGKMTIIDQYKNTALITGGLTHNHFSKMALDINMKSSKFEVINLQSNESEVFYGNLIAKLESLTIRGPFDDINVRINKAEAAEKSQLFLPLSSSNEEIGAYSYVRFKTSDEEEALKEKTTQDSKLSIHIDALMNPLMEITMIMDPSTGDAITASGTGSISIDIPPNNDIRMYGKYSLEKGSYTFTLPQLFFKRNFTLDKGGVIQFVGPIDNTQLNVSGIYKTRARLYDLLSPSEKELVANLGERELNQAKMMSEIDVILKMSGSLGTPELSFNLEMVDKSSAGTFVYKKLEQVNQDQGKLFNQVASLLLVNTFMPDEGGFDGGARSGVVNNVSDIFSGTASSQLTNLISKLTGDDDIAINLKYQKYNYNADNTSGGDRNALSLNVRKNLLKDRLSIEVGSSLDWGKPTASGNTSTFNPVGDFRLQYLIKEGGNLRGNIFRTSSYDALAESNITRGGIGLSWRKSFNNLREFFGGSKYMRKEEEEAEKQKAELEEE